MARIARLPMLLALTALLAAAAANPAEAAKRRVPFGFFGTVLNPQYSSPGATSDGALDAQAALMARSGVESLRVTFSWTHIETAQGDYDWTTPDRLVRVSARHGIPLLANVISTPRWASERPSNIHYARFSPRDPEVFGSFMRALVGRYGPRGSFWAENPTLPRIPVRQWQIWNEQRAPWFWATQPWARTYTRLLRAAHVAAHAADPGARIVAGSLVALGSASTQWGQARDLYRAGARRYFDVVAVHPFTDGSIAVRQSVERVFEIVRRVRRVMRRAGDRRKPIILTELTWPAARGKVPKRRLLGLETTARGQVQRLRLAYRRLARERRRHGVTQAYWFTWATPYDDDAPESDVSYRFSGLVRGRNGVFTPMPVLRAYAGMAARYEGCRKSSDARRCRP